MCGKIAYARNNCPAIPFGESTIAYIFGLGDVSIGGNL
jgi:hypothetical protein